LASPLPPWRCTVSGGAFEVFPRRPAFEIRCRTRASGPPPLGLHFRALSPGWAREPSSRGLGRPSSPPTSAQVSTPGAAFATPSGERCHPSALVPPSQFRTAWTACSTWASRVCCAPLPVGCSPRFADLPPRDRSQGRRSVPRDAFHTLRSSTRRQPLRVTAVRAFLPFAFVRGVVRFRPLDHVAEVARGSSHARTARASRLPARGP
jgi:hypothetical protein